MVPKPGLFASGTEKAYHRGVLAYFAGDRAATVAAFEEALVHDATLASAHLFAGVAASNLDDEGRAAAGGPLTSTRPAS